MSAGRRWANRLVCLFTATALAACYESPRPLAPEGKVRHDVALLGKWHCVPDTTEKSDEQADLQVLPFDDFQYYAEWTEKDKITRYRAYGVQMGQVVLLNVQELTSEPRSGKWVFVRYRLEGPGKLKLAVVGEKAVKGRDETEQLGDIRSRAAEDALYDPFAECTREQK